MARFAAFLASTLLLLALGVVACGSNDKNAGGGSTTYTVAGLREVAHDIYEARQNNVDLRPSVSALLQAFDLKLSTALDAPTLQAELATGHALILPPQIDQMADAMGDGVLVSLDSFVAAMNAKGATIKASGAPLSVAFFTDQVTPLLVKPELGIEETLPVMVAVLGQERAVRDQIKNPDPVWGDRRLDPLQFTLLLNTVLHTSSYRRAKAPPSAPVSSTSSGLAPAENGAAGFALDKAQGYVEGLYEEQMQIPITTETARKVSLCVSLVLYGYKTSVKVVPNPIWHRQADGVVPSLAVLTATVDFVDDYFNNYYGVRKDILSAIGCDLPHKGPIDDGKSLEWSAQEPLPDHGRYDLAASLTKDGKALATFRAIDETTPAAKRVFKNQHDVTGRVSVQVSGLVPGMDNLETIVTFLRETGTNGRANLTIDYYVDPCAAPAVSPGGDETCTPAWAGTSSVETLNAGTYSANVTFEWVETVDAVARFAPKGTVSVLIPGCTITPASHVIAPEEGELNVDYNYTPPMYYGAGRTQWAVTMDCGSGPASSLVGEPWFDAPLNAGGGTALSADGTTMAGSVSEAGMNSTWDLHVQAN